MDLFPREWNFPEGFTVCMEGRGRRWRHPPIIFQLLSSREGSKKKRAKWKRGERKNGTLIVRVLFPAGPYYIPGRRDRQLMPDEKDNPFTYNRLTTPTFSRYNRSFNTGWYIIRHINKTGRSRLGAYIQRMAISLPNPSRNLKNGGIWTDKREKKPYCHSISSVSNGLTWESSWFEREISFTMMTSV